MEKIKYFSLFTGIGGFELAIKDSLNAECVGWSEIDKYAISVFAHHFKEYSSLNFGDIERLVFDVSERGEFIVNENRVKCLPDMDMLVGGSPCQDLSINNLKRKGLQGSRSRLFFAFLEILRIKKPKFFILENVASMSKESKKSITDYIEMAYGKRVEPMKICSSAVSAQNRERLYWFPWEVEYPKDRGITIERNGVPIHAWSKSVRKDGSFDERIRVNGKANSLTCSIDGTESIGFFPSEKLDFKPRKVWKRSELFYHNIKKDQKLTVSECEFLQTFPSGWVGSISKNQAHKCLGNAVNVETVKHILRGLIK